MGNVTPAVSETEALRGLQDLAPEDRAAHLRTFLHEARSRLAAEHAAGVGGDVTARSFSLAVDGAVRALFTAARRRETPEVSLVAVGGYGRAELCPASDLDLWLITEHPDEPELSRVANEILYPLWDLRLDVGHAVRSPASCVTLAHEDLTAATALLDARFVAGDRGPFEALLALRRRHFSEHEAVALARRLVDDKARRHARFGDTVFLLEPDVKNGEGAYRDLLAATWAAKARFRVEELRDVVRLGQASERQVGALVEARRFYLTVRTAAHLFAKRRQDRLLFEVQEAIAPSLAPPQPEQEDAGVDAIRPAVTPAVEWLMQRYYLHAKAVKREGDRLLERCAEGAAKRPVARRIDHAFVLWNGQLTTVGPEVFRERPAEMVRIFRVAVEVCAPLHGHTRDLIAETCSRPETARALAREPSAARELLTLLTDERDARSPSFLEQAHDLGLLAAMMPEFGPCTGRVQHDLYHVFTVDQHLLYAVGRLKAIARGEHAGDLPVATRAMAKVERRLALYLGTLLHDVGKPLGKNHSERGALLARDIGRRLRLSPDDQVMVEFLVREHLVLARVSQRRDQSDAEMIARLAAQIGSAERLRALYLLTVADMAMVAPGNLTTWKEQLLRDLYVRTLAHFRVGADATGTERSRRLARKKERAATLALGSRDGVGPADVPDEETVRRFLASMPARYFASTPSRMVARHVILSCERERRGELVAVELLPGPADGFALTVIADDAPGLLARIAGVLHAHRLDVHGAHIHSRDRGGRAEAIDVFWIRDLHQRGFGASRIERFREDLRRVLAGEVAVETVIAERRERTQLPPRVRPPVPTRVEIDEETSAEYSVIDVFTEDRPGVLYAITRTLSELGLDIHLSKVSTEADRVADVFYVRDPRGHRVDARSDEVTAALRGALSQLAS